MGEEQGHFFCPDFKIKFFFFSFDEFENKRTLHFFPQVIWNICTRKKKKEFFEEDITREGGGLTFPEQPTVDNIPNHL